MRPHRYSLRLIGFATFVSVLAAVGAGSAVAGKKPPIGNCDWGALTQPFLPWNDDGDYFLAPAGSFEGDVSDWTLDGGAAVVAGNEDSYIGSPTDASSLALPPDSSATTPTICVTIHSPTLRVFGLNTGKADGKLEVFLNYTDNKGNPKTTRVATLDHSTSWELSPEIKFLKWVEPILKQHGQTDVSFTFAPKDAKSSWRIDDMYVDPLKNH